MGYDHLWAQVNQKWTGSGSELECEGSTSAVCPAIFKNKNGYNLYLIAKAMFRIKKDGRKNDGKNDRTSKLIQ